jgi:hypothetical protein
MPGGHRALVGRQVDTTGSNPMVGLATEAAAAAAAALSLGRLLTCRVIGVRPWYPPFFLQAPWARARGGGGVF